ncbi:MAG: hypothetical protein WBN77_00800 [Desulfobacterales bacterium]
MEELKYLKPGKDDIMDTKKPIRSIIFFISAMFLVIISCSSKEPDINIVDGKLRPCPKSPNCVSKEPDEKISQIAPFVFSLGSTEISHLDTPAWSL